MYNLDNFNARAATEGGIENHTYIDADTEPNNKIVEMRDSLEGGMTLEFKSHQDEDMERDLLPLQVRCTQDENDKSLSNLLHGKEEKFEPDPN